MIMIKLKIKSHFKILCPDEKLSFKCKPSITAKIIKEYMAG